MLNQRINELRSAHGWSQVELAKRLNVTKQTVSNWENNNILPSVEMLKKLSGVFHVSCDYLLGLDDHRTLEVDGLSDSEIAHIQMIVEDIRRKK